jgi:hypothetical protein
MLLGTLDARYLRDTYLRGIDLGQAWQGPQGDAALERLLAFWQVAAERILGVSFCGTRVRVMPDATLKRGIDYEREVEPIPYMPPDGTPPSYRLYVRFRHVLTIDRVRLFQGWNYDASAPPVAAFETIAPVQVQYFPLERRVRIPAGAVTQPTVAQAWAVDYTYGLGEIPLEVVNWICLGTTMLFLALVGSGQDLTHGIARESLSMDGVTETLTYARGKYGPYSGTIEAMHAEWAMINLPALRPHFS